MTTFNTTSKASMLLATGGFVGGVLYSQMKGKPMQSVVITGLIFGVCGYLAGNALTKLYQ